MKVIYSRISTIRYLLHSANNYGTTKMIWNPPCRVETDDFPTEAKSAVAWSGTSYLPVLLRGASYIHSPYTVSAWFLGTRIWLLFISSWMTLELAWRAICNRRVSRICVVALPVLLSALFACILPLYECFSYTHYWHINIVNNTVSLHNLSASLLYKP
jgi:hypothetical protein